jgi:hypothetical protein
VQGCDFEADRESAFAAQADARDQRNIDVAKAAIAVQAEAIAKTIDSFHEIVAAIPPPRADNDDVGLGTKKN